MYTTQKTGIAKLRSYRAEVASRYEAALRRHDADEAHRLFELLRRVRRAILIYEEFHTSPEPVLANHLRN